ncbi:hypothetical protein [Nostoc sp.]|uniref:hypothetical protein n=1 Tax=Nostoc sp. TaxID=1180 RepID=UPI002FFA0C55
MQNTLFTELSVSEEASLSGGTDPKPKDPSNKVKIGKKAKVGVGGGAVSGGVAGSNGSSGSATGGDGVYDESDNSKTIIPPFFPI